MNPRNIVNVVGYYPNPEKMGKGIMYKEGVDGKKSFYRGKISVRRAFKGDDGEYKYDFIPFKAFGHNADYINKYVKTKDVVAIQGELHIEENYEDKDGNVVYGQPIILADSVAIVSSSSPSSDQKVSSPSSTATKKESPLSKLRNKRNVVS